MIETQTLTFDWAIYANWYTQLRTLMIELFPFFKLSELQANGTNYGKKASEYLPTITPLHVNCRCALVEIPPGWSFNEEGQMIYKGPNYNQYSNQ